MAKKNKTNLTTVKLGQPSSTLVSDHDVYQAKVESCPDNHKILTINFGQFNDWKLELSSLYKRPSGWIVNIIMVAEMVSTFFLGFLINKIYTAITISVDTKQCVEASLGWTFLIFIFFLIMLILAKCYGNKINNFDIQLSSIKRVSEEMDRCIKNMAPNCKKEDDNL